MTVPVVVRGGGDLASGVVYRLAKAGIRVVVTELSQPLAIRRLVSFAEAVYSNAITIEGVRGQLITNPLELNKLSEDGIIPVLVDPDGLMIQNLHPWIVVDGRMRKSAPATPYSSDRFTIGLGPGFIAGGNCNAVIETKRGHTLGRVFWNGQAEADTGVPETIANQSKDRVLRAPENGVLECLVRIGEVLEKGTPIARVGSSLMTAPFKGALRGLLHEGLVVNRGMKIGDLDPRADPSMCALISDKALAIGGGVLEAILTIPRLREILWAK